MDNLTYECGHCEPPRNRYSLAEYPRHINRCLGLRIAYGKPPNEVPKNRYCAKHDDFLFAGECPICRDERERQQVQAKRAELAVR